ncbi:MAG: ABC transporter substrate-binding protein [Spirulina sp. SIO3F2]|nr:ABC transporter substrate-binding protein [Spirulina sp. SIO3F2]
MLRGVQSRLSSSLKSQSVRLLASLFVMVLLLTLSLPGCIGQNAPTKTLQIGITQWPGFDVAIYAKEAGLFEKRGLDVEFVRFDNQQDSSRAVLRGRLDAAFTALWDILQSTPGEDQPAFIMVTNVSAGADGIVTQPEFKSLEALKDKQVGVKLGTVNHLIWLEALDKYQIDPQTIEIQDVSNEIAAQMMSEGKLDGAVLWEPLLGEIAEEIQGNIPYTTKDLDSLVIDGLISSVSTVQAKQAEFKQFVLAWFDLMHLLEVDPKPVFELVGQQLDISPEDFANDYAGLEKGDIEMNRAMFQADGRLPEAMLSMGELFEADPRHGRVIRDDIQINAEAVNQAIEIWKP